MIHSRSLTIEAALRDCVNLPVKEFALVVVLENGHEKTYTSQSLSPYQPRIFMESFRREFRQSVRRAAAEESYNNSAYGQEHMYSEFETDEHRKSSSGESSSGRRRRHYHQQSTSDDSDEHDTTNGKRKRARGSLYPGLDVDNDDTPQPVSVQWTQQPIIGDEIEVEKFYFQRFKDMQQSSCKVMGKVFVKLIEPKKQTNHPYAKGDKNAPTWWPKTTGEECVRHKEPDHLLKSERVRLLVHILRMVVEPSHKQHVTIQKLGLNVQKLEEVTMDAMSNWFNDKDHRENSTKRPFLKEIFKVANAEERYKNDEIDASTRIPVMYDDKVRLDVSDEEEGLKDENDENEVITASSSIPTLERLSSKAMMQSQHLQLQQENDPALMFLPIRPLPVRYHPQSQMDDHAAYTDPSYMPRAASVAFQPQSHNPHVPNRRSFDSPGYQSPQSMYGWQNNPMVSNANASSNYYVTSHQTTLPPQVVPCQLPQPVIQQPILPPPISQHDFDGLPNARQYDSGPALRSQLRTGSLGHPHHVPPSFQYFHENGGYGHNDSHLKDDQHFHSHR